MPETGHVPNQGSYVVSYDPKTYTGASVYSPMRQDAVISGETRIDGVLAGGIDVYLIWRPTMMVVDATVSASDGTYSFTNVGADTTNYTVYFKDSPTGLVYNDIVYALIDTSA